MSTKRDKKFGIVCIEGEPVDYEVAPSCQE